MMLQGEVMIFQAQSLAKLARVVAVHGVFVTSLSFSPDSTKLLSTSGDTAAHVCQVCCAPTHVLRSLWNTHYTYSPVVAGS